MSAEDNLVRARILATRKLGVAPGLPISALVFALMDRLAESERTVEELRMRLRRVGQ